ncbi:MAG: FAD-dependent oxidoreductase [Alphaproteobacteria bacterium]|nr:FAD-dependent oxidoreductase [Alphaproteobacteria bacterium]
MTLTLLRLGLGRKRPPERALPAVPPLQPHYDVVVIGGGGHGLSIAYHLARYHGIRNVAVLERGYLAGGNTARNTAVIRANYISPEATTFYRESLKLFQNMSDELDFNILFSVRGQLTLAHTDASIRTFRQRAEVNTFMGVDSVMVELDEIAKICPQLDLSSHVRYPIQGGLWHPPGAIARHDAVAWAYARRAAELGVEIHTRTEVTGIEVENGRVQAVRTARGRVACGAAVQAVAGWSSEVARLAGIRLPIRSFPLQAMVSQPLKPFLDPLISSAQLHCYVSQTPRGELVIGGGSDPYPLYRTRSTLDLKESLIAHTLELFPFLARVKLLRQWAGVTDMTPDYSPIMGPSGIAGYYLDAGWGTWGFKATAICGKTMAATIASGTTDPLITRFALDRFKTYSQVNEMGATAASH